MPECPRECQGLLVEVTRGCTRVVIGDLGVGAVHVCARLIKADRDSEVAFSVRFVVVVAPLAPGGRPVACPVGLGLHKAM